MSSGSGARYASLLRPFLHVHIYEIPPPAPEWLEGREKRIRQQQLLGSCQFTVPNFKYELLHVLSQAHCLYVLICKWEADTRSALCLHTVQLYEKQRLSLLAILLMPSQRVYGDFFFFS